MGAASAELAHMELAGLVAAAEGGHASAAVAAATPPAVSKLSRCLRRIKRMEPQDDRGFWLLNNLLSQVSLRCHSGVLDLREENFARGVNDSHTCHSVGPGHPAAAAVSAPLRRPQALRQEI